MLKIKTLHHYTVALNSDTIWGTDYRGLECVLFDSEHEDGEGDCVGVLIADSRKHMIDVMMKNAIEHHYACVAVGRISFMPTRKEIESILEVRENSEEMGYDTAWEGQYWAQRYRSQGKYLLMSPLHLEDLIPIDADAAKQLFKIGHYTVGEYPNTETAHVLSKIIEHCKNFL
jgi:hypothetical protein